MTEVIKKVKKTFYVAFDGTEFEEKEACETYEKRERSLEGFVDGMITRRENIRLVVKWSDEKRYAQLLKVMESGDIIEEQGVELALAHKKGGGAGMGQYPPSITVYMLYKFED